MEGSQEGSSLGVGVTLTEDEEAQLLAEYGVEGPYDDLLDLPADSKFRSDVSGPNVFLTGAQIEEGDDNGNDSFVVDNVGLPYLSLRSLLVKHTGVFDSNASSDLVTNTAEVLQKLDNNNNRRSELHAEPTRATPVSSSTDSVSRTTRHVFEVQQAKEKIKALYKQYANAVCSNSDEAEDILVFDLETDYDQLLEKSEALLRYSEQVLERPNHFDPVTDEKYKKRLAEIALEDRAEGIDEFDDFLDKEDLLEDDDAEEILTKSHAIEEKMHALLAKHGIRMDEQRSVADAPGSRAEEDEEDRSTAKRTVQRGLGLKEELLSMQQECLFSFEFEPTREERQAIAAWDEVLERTDQVPGPVIPPPPLMLSATASGEKEEDTLHAVQERLTEVFASLKEFISQEVTEVDKSTKTKQMVKNSDENIELIPVESTLAARDAYAEELAEKDITELLERRIKAQEELQAHRAITQVKLQPFETVVNHLLPPAEMELELTPEEIQKSAEGDNDPLKSSDREEKQHEENQKKEKIAERERKLLRKSERQLHLMKLEETEFSLMRAEDVRMQQVVRMINEKLDHIHDLMLECEKEFLRKQEYIVEDETAERAQIKKRKEDHMKLTLRAMEVRQFQMSLEKANAAFNEYLEIHKQLCREEAESYDKLIAAKKENENEIRRQLKERTKAELEAKHQLILSMRKMFMAHQLHLDEKDLSGVKEHRNSVLPVFFLSTRLTLLYEGLIHQRSWQSKKSKALLNLQKKVHEEVHTLPAAKPDGQTLTMANRIRRDAEKLLSSNTSQMTNDKKNEALGVNTLDADRLKDLISISIAAAQKDPHGAPHYFHSLLLSLENIASVDYSSLLSLTVAASPTGSKTSNLPMRFIGRDLSIAEFVREIDLSSNQLDVVYLMDLLHVFPFLTKITCASNCILSITDSLQPVRPSSMRGVTAAQENSFSEKVMVRELDVSCNKIRDISAIGKYLSSSLQTFTAHTNDLQSVDGLMTCLHMESINVSKNAISTVEPLVPLTLLSVLDAADNSISSIDCLSENNFLLEKVYLSRNPLKRLPPSAEVFWFLRQLFLNDCGLETLAWCAVPWMPHLTILQANANKIQSISGLSKCPRLNRLHLAHNCIGRLEDLNPLISCQRLVALDVSSNPLLSFFESSASIEPKPKANEGGKPSEEKGDGIVPKRTEVTGFSVEVEQMLMHHLLSLRELNNCLLPSQPLTDKYKELNPRCDGRLIDNIKDLREPLFQIPQLYYVECSDPVVVYERALFAISSDLCVGNIQNSAEVLEIRGKQRHRAAEALEEQISGRMTESKRDYLPLVHRLSHHVQEQYRREHLKCSEESLVYINNNLKNELKGTNHHVRYANYAQKALARREKHAKELIAEWIHGRLLIRRAVQELQQRREEFYKSEQFRFGEAAKVIQRVGRGAIIRNRLRHIKKDDLMDDIDSAVLADLDTGLEETAVTVDVRSILGSVLQKVNPETKQRFEVPESLPLRHPVNNNVLGLAGAHRAGSAPEGIPLGSTRLVDDEYIGRPSTGKAEDRKESEWDERVAMQIKKKNDRRNREQKKIQREEMLKNPLKVKQQLKRT